MYEGFDSCHNMTLILQKSYEDIERLQCEEFSICRHKDKVFLEDDYHFLDD